MALSKEDTETLKAAASIIKRELEANAPKTGDEGAGSLSLYKFGTFKIKTAPARKARNPKTGATLDIPARTVVRFHASKAWTEAL